MTAYSDICEAVTFSDACLVAYRWITQLFTVDRFFCCVVDENKKDGFGGITIDFPLFIEDECKHDHQTRRLKSDELLNQVFVYATALASSDGSGYARREKSLELDNMKHWSLFPLMSSASAVMGVLGICRKNENDFSTVESTVLSSVANALSQVLVRQQVIRRMKLNERKNVIDEVSGSFFHEIINEFVPLIINVQRIEEALRNAEVNYPAEIEQNLDSIAQQAKNLHSVTKQQWDQLKTHLYEPVVQELTVEEIISEARRGISLECDISLNLDENTPRVQGFHRDLSDALRELLRNAQRAMQGSIRKEIDISSEAWQDEQERVWVKITITDTGCGIEPENIDKIGRLSFSTKYASGGFGVYWVKNVIEKSCGTIEVQSEVNKGTTFIIRLPLSNQKTVVVSV